MKGVRARTRQNGFNFETFLARARTPFTLRTPFKGNLFIYFFLSFIIYIFIYTHLYIPCWALVRPKSGGSLEHWFKSLKEPMDLAYTMLNWVVLLCWPNVGPMLGYAVPRWAPLSFQIPQRLPQNCILTSISRLSSSEWGPSILHWI